MTTGLALALAALTLAVLALVLAPLLRRPGRGAPAMAAGRAAFDLAVYRDQLAEVDRDRERGLIDDDQAKAARLEIERRILSATRRSEGAGGGPTRPEQRGGRRWAAAAALAVALPGLSAALYLALGSPHLPDRPLAARRDEPSASPAPDLVAQAERLERRLAEQPDELSHWVSLGRTYLMLGRGDDAVRAFRRALDLGPDDDPLLLASLGEALVRAAGGIVTPEAKQKFEAALKARDGEPVSRYFLALAAAQAGRLQEAVDMWHALLADSPPDAPWREQVIAAMRTAAGELGQTVAAVPPPAGDAGGGAGAPAAAPPGVPPDAAARIAAMDPADRAEAIRGMVEGLAARLEEQPDDVEGWLRLGRARLVLGQPELAREAYKRAVELSPESPRVLKAYAAALLGPADPASGAPPEIGEEAAELYRRAAELDPDDPEPRWYVGLAALQTGNAEEAFETWRALLDDAPVDAPWRPQVAAALRTVADQLGRDPGDLPEVAAAAAAPPAPPRAATPPPDGVPAGEEAARIAALDPEVQSEAIRGMVDGLAARLEEQPDDLAGWLRLGRARLVLGQPEQAREAYERALALSPDSPTVLKAYASALLGPVDPESGAPEVGEEAADLFRRAAEADPADPEPRWYLGLAALQAGDRDGAAEQWRRLLAGLDPGDPNSALVRRWLEEVEG